MDFGSEWGTDSFTIDDVTEPQSFEELMDLSIYPFEEYYESHPEPPQQSGFMNHTLHSQISFQKPYIKEELDTKPFYVPPKTEPAHFNYYTEPPFIKEPNVTQALDIVIDNEPPVEVRTRTPSEMRTFGVSARVVGDFKMYGASIVNVRLCYAATDNLKSEPVEKDILGGRRTVPVLSDGSVVFDSLSICESSTKHKEREFCLEFVLLRNDGQELLRKRSRSFYAYSHKKVLQRRGNVKLRALNKAWGRISGGEQMHVIGQPFIQGPAINLIFRTPHGDITAKPLEYYSDSVLFFELPPYPIPEGMTLSPDTEIRVQVLVTNDGRTFSNPLEFIYVAAGTDRDRPRSRY